MLLVVACLRDDNAEGIEHHTLRRHPRTVDVERVASPVVVPHHEEVRAVKGNVGIPLVVRRLRDDEARRVKQGTLWRHPRAADVGVTTAALVFPHHEEVRAVKGNGRHFLGARRGHERAGCVNQELAAQKLVPPSLGRLGQTAALPAREPIRLDRTRPSACRTQGPIGHVPARVDLPDHFLRVKSRLRLNSTKCSQNADHRNQNAQSHRFLLSCNDAVSVGLQVVLTTETGSRDFRYFLALMLEPNPE